MSRLAWLSLPLVACVSGASEPDTEDMGFTVNIASPAAGASFGWGEAIPLDVEVARDGASIEPDAVAWTIGAWAAEGDAITAEGVPAGEHTVTAAVLVDGIAGSATTPIRVDAPPDLNYRGPMTSTLALEDGENAGSAACSGTVDFVLQGGATITGTGQAECTYQILVFTERFDVTYVLEGTLVQGVASGTLSTQYDGQTLSMPWMGTGNYGTTIGGSFDLQQSQDGGSMHLYGDFQADPR